MARFAHDGTLPNLGRILAEGTWTRALPSLPTVTAVNWTTMVTGLHCGSHGRPYSDHKLRYFWEAAIEAGIPVGLANIEHNEVVDGSFFVGHPRSLAGPKNIKVEPGPEVDMDIKDEEGDIIANVSCSVSESLHVAIRGESSASLTSPLDEMSQYAVFRTNDGTRACTRFKYLEKSKTVYISPIRTMQDFAQPTDIEPKLLEIAGPPPVKGFPLFHHRLADLDTAIEEEMYHAGWFGRVAAGMMGNYEDSLWFHRHNTTDGIGHYYLGLVDEKAYCYDPENLETNWNALRRWYKTVDVVLGDILDGDPGANFAMCTDHGHVGYSRLVSLAKIFTENGLAKAHPMRAAALDRESSKVWISAEEIFVNRGIVQDEVEYEEIREKVIFMLRELVDPDDSNRPVAMAIRREDAQSLSFWGKPRGDILFLLEGGYFATGPLVTDGVFQQLKIPANSSVHHGCFPGYETEIGSTFSFMAFSGHGAGERNIGEKGAPHLVDFAPTVLAILGASDPGLQGKVLWDMIGLDRFVRCEEKSH